MGARGRFCGWVHWNFDFSKTADYFDKRTLREKVLLIVFIWIILLIGLSLTLDGVSNSWQKIKTHWGTLSNQSFWLNNQNGIREQLEKALLSVNPSKTYNASKLIEFLDTQSRSLGINYELSSPRTEVNDLFNIHSVNVNIRGASMKQLLELDTQIQQFFPNIILNSVLLNASRTNPALVDARFVVNSIELDPSKINQRP